MNIRSQVLLNSDSKTASVVLGDDGLPTQIQVLPQGDFKTPYHGNFEIDSEDLLQYVQNFNSSIRASGGIPINFDHNDGPAAGWITNLFVGNDGFLWADVSWTDVGAEALKNKQYRFISPEFCPEYENPQQAGDFTENVMIGAGLTNTPLFTQLKPLVANNQNKKGSERLTDSGTSITIYAEEGEKSMNLDDLRAKDPSTLNEDERKFLADHASELTAEEQQKFGVTPAAEPESTPEEQPAPETPKAEAPTEQPAPEADPVEASSKKSVTITASELHDLKEAAAKGALAHESLLKKEAGDKVKTFIAKGQIKASQENDAVKLLIEHGAAFEAFVSGLPENRLITAGELGHGDKGSIGSAAVALREATEAKMASEKVDYVTAMRMVIKETPQLAEEYDKELVSINK